MEYDDAQLAQVAGTLGPDDLKLLSDRELERYGQLTRLKLGGPNATSDVARMRLQALEAGPHEQFNPTTLPIPAGARFPEPGAPPAPEIAAPYIEDLKQAPQHWANLFNPNEYGSIFNLGNRAMAGEVPDWIRQGVRDVSMGAVNPATPNPIAEAFPQANPGTQPQGMMAAANRVAGLPMQAVRSLVPGTDENAAVSTWAVNTIASAPGGIAGAVGKWITKPDEFLAEDPAGFFMTAELMKAPFRLGESAAGPAFEARVVPPVERRVSQTPLQEGILRRQGDLAAYEKAKADMAARSQTTPAGEAILNAIDERAKAHAEAQMGGTPREVKVEIPGDTASPTPPIVRVEINPGAEVPATDAGATAVLGGAEANGLSGGRGSTVSAALATGVKTLLSEQMKFAMGGGDLANMKMLGDGIQAVKSFIEDRMGTRIPYWWLADSAPQLHAALFRYMGGYQEARIAANEHMAEINKLIGNDKGKYDLLGRYVVHKQLEALLKNPDLAESVNTRQMLNEDALAGIAADPAMKAAIDYIQSKVIPDFMRFNKDAGIGQLRDTDLYMKLVKAEEGPRGTLYVDQQGRVAPQRKILAGSARRATGTGTYSVDLATILERTFRDKLTAARHNQLNDVVQSFAIPVKRGEALPDTVQFGGEDVPVRYVEVKRPTITVEDGEVQHVSSGRVPVPKPVADAYESMMRGGAEANVPSLNALSRLATASFMMFPPAAIAHYMNVFGAAYRIAGITEGSRLGLLAKYDPTTFIRDAAILSRAADMSGADFAADMRTVAEYGGHRVSHMVPKGPGASWLDAVPGLKPFLKTKESVFGYPGTDTAVLGLRGAEARMRTMAFRVIRDKMIADGAIDAKIRTLRQAADAKGIPYDEAGFADVARRAVDAEAVMKMANEFGPYAQKMMPPLVKALRSVPLFGDPFAVAGVHLTKGAVKAQLGFGPMGWDPEIAWVHLAAPTLSWALINKARDPEGRWPWDRPGNAKVPYGAIRWSSTPQGTVDIPMSFWAPGPGRAVSNLGLANAIKNIANGHTDPAEWGAWFVTTAANDVIHRAGPTGKLLNLMATGNATHLNQAGEWMELVPPQVSIGETFKERAKATALALQPTIGAEAGPFVQGGRGPESPMGKVTVSMLALMGRAPKFGAPESEQAGSDIRLYPNRVREVAGSIAIQMLQQPPEKRAAFYAREWKKRITDDPIVKANPQLQALAQRSFMGTLTGHTRSVAVSGAQAAVK